ncbi:MAG: hypothetical protein KC620_09365 [Myxococcales bacterium]|nr:hypothetical protein [Myxococcales bacterium]
MRRAALIRALPWLLLASPASAFTVASGFTDPCHERISLVAFSDFVLDLPLFGLVPPAANEWHEIAEFLLRDFNAANGQPLDDAHAFVMVSLLVGVRSPDTDGHSLLDLASLRRLHADPDDEGQYAHSLRGINDNGPEGDVKAVEGTRRLLRKLIDQATEAQNKPLAEQFIKAPVYFDFYGRFEVDVWAPAYYLGRAAHALEDSFAHTIRDDASELHQIVTVFNYVEAITGDFKESRDGLRHSNSTDTCANAPELFNAASQAAIDMMLAAREMASGRDPDAIDDVLDGWVTLRPGCTKANDYCDNKRWLELAQREPTHPYLGCTATPGPRGGPWWLLLSALAFVPGRARARRRR